MRIVFFMVAIYFSSIVLAGGVVGNGGDGIVCKDKDSVELFDARE